MSPLSQEEGRKTSKGIGGIGGKEERDLFRKSLMRFEDSTDERYLSTATSQLDTAMAAVQRTIPFKKLNSDLMLVSHKVRSLIRLATSHQSSLQLAARIDKEEVVCLPPPQAKDTMNGTHPPRPNGKQVVICDPPTTMTVISRPLNTHTESESGESESKSATSKPLISPTSDSEKSSPKSPKNLSCIVFCQMRLTVLCISKMLENLQHMTKLLDPLKVFPLQSGYLIAGKTQTNMHEHGVIEKFKDGRINFLLATDIVEEGLDVQSCHLVINFDDLMTTKSFIQRRGRARSMRSSMISLIWRENLEFSIRELKTFVMQEIEMRKGLVEMLKAGSASQTVEEEGPWDDEDQECFYQLENSDVFTNTLSAKDIVFAYTQSLSHDRYYNPRPIYTFTIEEMPQEVSDEGSDDRQSLACTNKEYGYRCSLLLPKAVPQVARYHVSRVCRSKRLAQGLVALRLVEQLHQIGELDDKLLVKYHSLAEEVENNARKEETSMIDIDVKSLPDCLLRLPDCAVSDAPSLTAVSVPPQEERSTMLHCYELVLDLGDIEQKKQMLNSYDVLSYLKSLQAMGFSFHQKIPEEILEHFFSLYMAGEVESANEASLAAGSVSGSVSVSVKVRYLGARSFSDRGLHYLKLFHQSIHHRTDYISMFYDSLANTSASTSASITNDIVGMVPTLNTAVKSDAPPGTEPPPPRPNIFFCSAAEQQQRKKEKKENKEKESTDKLHWSHENISFLSYDRSAAKERGQLEEVEKIIQMIHDQIRANLVGGTSTKASELLFYTMPLPKVCAGQCIDSRQSKPWEQFNLMEESIWADDNKFTLHMEHCAYDAQILLYNLQSTQINHLNMQAANMVRKELAAQERALLAKEQEEEESQAVKEVEEVGAFVSDGEEGVGEEKSTAPSMKGVDNLLAKPRKKEEVVHPLTPSSPSPTSSSSSALFPSAFSKHSTPLYKKIMVYEGWYKQGTQDLIVVRSDSHQLLCCCNLYRNARFDDDNIPNLASTMKEFPGADITYANYFLSKLGESYLPMIDRLKTDKNHQLLPAFTLSHKLRLKSFLAPLCKIEMDRQISHFIPELCCPIGQASWYYAMNINPSVVHRLQSLFLSLEARTYIQRSMRQLEKDMYSRDEAERNADAEGGDSEGKVEGKVFTAEQEGEQEDRFAQNAPSVALMLEALTPKMAMEDRNYERLEMLGDTILKFAASVHLFNTYLDQNQVYTLYTPYIHYMYESYSPSQSLALHNIISLSSLLLLHLLRTTGIPHSIAFFSSQ